MSFTPHFVWKFMVFKASHMSQRSFCLGMPYDHQIWSAGSLTEQHNIGGGFEMTRQVKGDLEVNLFRNAWVFEL